MAKQRLFSLLSLLVLCVALARAADLSFSEVVVTLSDDDRIMLDAQIRYQLNATASEALENGVPLTFETHVEVRAADAWVWSPDVVDYRIRSTLRYRPLSSLYEVRTLGNEGKQVFATRAAALRYMGLIRNMALIERSRLDAQREYIVRLNAHLDIEALPLPMRPKAYLSSDWDIAAEPWEWRLKP